MLLSPFQILKTHASRQEIIQIYGLKCLHKYLHDLIANFLYELRFSLLWQK